MGRGHAFLVLKGYANLFRWGDSSPERNWEAQSGDELRQVVPEMKKGAGASPLLLN